MRVGDKFNRLEFIEDLGMVEYGTQGLKHRMGLFLCDCGNFTSAPCSTVKYGGTKSCGCYLRDATSIANTTHGLWSHPLHGVWTSMKQRCCNPKNIKYKNYGLKGVNVCNEWKEFINFYNWATTNGWKEGLQIDRINNDGNYEPSNCQFVTIAQNCSIGKRGLMCNNKSGYIGVSFVKKTNKWYSRIMVNGKDVYLGSFKSIDEAVEARIAKEVELFGEQRTNFHYNKKRRINYEQNQSI